MHNPVSQNSLSRYAAKRFSLCPSSLSNSPDQEDNRNALMFVCFRIRGNKAAHTLFFF